MSWPAGVGGKGNEGVAGYVKQIPNSIGYVEYAYVLQNNMSYALLQNSAGAFVAPSADSFQAAAVSADWKNAEDFFLVMTNAPGANAYPITASTFIVMHKQPKDKARSDAALTSSAGRSSMVSRRLKSSIMCRFRPILFSKSTLTSAPASSEFSASRGAEKRRRR